MKSTTRSLRLLPALLVASGAFLGALPAAAVTIDSFTTNQATVSNPPGGATVATTAGADILGLRRALDAGLFTGGAGPVTTSVAAGVLTLAVTNTTPDSRGEAIVTWDGDATAGNLNVTGLASQNLTTGGHSAFRIRVNSASAGSEIVVDVHTSATAASRGFLRVPVAIVAATDLYLSYAHDFVAIAASPADFTNVGAMQMRVRGPEVSVAIDSVDTLGPNVTASKRDLALDNNPIAGTIPEGSTFKYRITVGNTGGMSQGTDLADTVDANTTLNAATLRATPVAINDSYVSAGNVGRTVAAPGLLANDFDPDTAGSAPELVVAAASVGTFATDLGGSITIAADGGFSYEPPVGAFYSVDTFTYTLQDNDAQTDTALFKIAIGPRVWFVDDAHPGTNVGTFANPFVGFTAGNVNGVGGAGDQDAAGDIIFLRSGNHAAAVELEASQWLLGEGEGLTIDGQQIVVAGTHPSLTSVGHGVILASNNTLRGFNVGNTAAANFGIVGSNFGTLTASNMSVSGTGGALSLTNGTLAATFASIQSTSGTHGINLDSAAGTLTVNGTTTLSNSAFGLRVNASGSLNASFSGTTSLTATAGTALLASTGGTLNFSGTSNTAIATGGPAVDLTSTSLGSGATFATASSSSSTGKGLNLDTVSGAFIASGGSISSPAGIGVDINAGSSTITYVGSVTSTAANRLIEVTGRTGGTVTLSGNLSGTGATHTGINIASNSGGTINFSGGTKTLNTSGNNAVTLATNTGATVNFTGGGLGITTTSGIGFNATGGATGISVQGSGNVISSTTGTAMNVASTTIAAAGMTFQSISANGATNGIVLNTTGASGGLNVTGVGTTPGSGGTLQNHSGRGAAFISAASISLKNMNITNTATSAGAPCGSAAIVAGNTGCNAAIHLQAVTGVSLDRMNLTTSGQQGINAIDVTNLTLTNSALSGLGNGADEDGLHMLNLLGTNTITNTTIASSGDDNVNIQNRSSTASTITISGGSFNTGVLGSGLLFGIRDTANTTVDISSVTLDNNFSGGVVADSFDTATMVVKVASSSIINNNDGVQVSASQTANAQFDINGNTFTGNDFLAVTLLKAAFSTAGTLEGAVRNNPITIANGRPTDAISIFQAGGGSLKVAVTGNTINYAGTQRAILMQAGQDGNGSIDATLTANNIDIQLDGVGNAVAGILAQTAITGPGNTASICADFGGAGGLRNTFTHSLGGTMAGGDIRARQRNDGTYRLPGYAGGATDTAAVVAYLSGRNTVVSAPTASADSTGFGGGGACAAPTIP